MNDTRGRLDEARREGHELQEHLQQRYEHDLDGTRRSLLLAWIAFGVTFAVLRAITYGIRAEIIPNINLATDALHIHHYVWGIALLLLVGYLALVDDKARRHRSLAVLYGIGAALVIDEFALLLNLRDVYFAEEGRWSVDIAFGIIAVLGAYVTAYRFWNGAAREVVRFPGRIARVFRSRSKD